MPSLGTALVAAVALVFVAGGVAGFHTPYKPEQSRHFDVTQSSTFVPVTDKVVPDSVVEHLLARSASFPSAVITVVCSWPDLACLVEAPSLLANGNARVALWPFP